ncbi:MAG: MFS transporter [Alkalispirochaeta sp.]
MKQRILLIVSFASFVILGLPDGMLGVAWPSISDGFRQPLGNLGVLMFGFTVGYVTTNAFLGKIIARSGYATVMTLSAVCLGVGALGMILSPWWLGAIVAMACIGTGSGLLDGGLNAYGAIFFRPRDLNWLHAFYGVGAALGPAIMTPLVISDIGWRGGYAVLALLSTGIVVSFLATRFSWLSRESLRTDSAGDAGGVAVENNSDETPVGVRTTVIAIASVLLFFLYTGIEVVAGQWAFSLFTIGRGIDAARAGTWVGVYWVALTVGRIVFGWVSERVAVKTIMRAVLAGAAVGIALLFFRSIPATAPVGLAILGFSLAPMFPLLIGETPRRVGDHLADHLVGFQIAAANIGAVSLVGLVGLGVERIGLELVPWALMASFLAFTILHELLYLAEPAEGRSPTSSR